MFLVITVETTLSLSVCALNIQCILSSVCFVVDVRGQWVEVGWAHGSHSLCGGSLCRAISLRLRPPSTSGPPDVSPGLITGSASSWGGGWRWRDEVEGERPAGREGMGLH